MKKNLLTILLSVFMVMTSFTASVVAEDVTSFNIDIETNYGRRVGASIEPDTLDPSYANTSLDLSYTYKTDDGKSLAPGDILTEGNYRVDCTVFSNNPIEYSLANANITVNGFSIGILSKSPAEITFEYPFTVNAPEPAVSYNVTYNANGANSGTAPANQTKNEGDSLTLASNTGNLVKDGYTFNGWNTQADGSGTHYDAGATYAADADLALYAEWATVETKTIADILPDDFPEINAGWSWENTNDNKLYVSYHPNRDYSYLDSLCIDNDNNKIAYLNKELSIDGDKNYFYSEDPNKVTFVMESGKLSKVKIEGYTGDKAKYNGDYTKIDGKILSEIFTTAADGFPYSDTGSAPKDSWLAENNINNKAYLSSDGFKYNNYSILPGLDSKVAKKVGNNYVYKENSSIYTFVMEEGILTSIEYKNTSKEIKYKPQEKQITVNDIVDTVNFPNSYDNGWKDSTAIAVINWGGTSTYKVYKSDTTTSSSLDFANGSNYGNRKLSIDRNTVVTKNGDTYSVDKDNYTIGFIMSNKILKEITVTDNNSYNYGHYCISVGDVLSKTSFPTSPDNAWKDAGGASMYCEGDKLAIIKEKDEFQPKINLISAVIEDKTNSKYLYGEVECVVDFIVENNVLTKVDVKQTSQQNTWAIGVYEQPITLTITGTYTYTGNPIVPTYSVVKGGKTLVKDTDFTEQLINNTNVGTATLKINLMGNYSGTLSKTFAIGKGTITPTVLLNSWTQGETANNPSVEGNSGSGIVTYEYKAKDAEDSTYVSTKPSIAGNYVVKATIAETDNYLGGNATSDFIIFNSSTTKDGNIETATLNTNENIEDTKLNPISKENALTIVGEGELKQAINNGKNVIIYTEVKKPSEESKQAFTSMNINETNAVILDINLYGEIVGEANSKKKITDTNGYKTTISITLTPQQASVIDISNNKNYFILRKHAGEIIKIPATLTTDASGNYVFTFETDKFSAYAIYSENKPVTPPGNYVIPNTGVEGSNNHSLLKLSSLSLLAIGTYIVIKKKKDN